LRNREDFGRINVIFWLVIEANEMKNDNEISEVKCTGKDKKTEENNQEEDRENVNQELNS